MTKVRCKQTNNADTELVTSVIPGYANDYDGHKLKKLVEKDLGKGIGDRNYLLLNNLIPVLRQNKVLPNGM